MNTKTIFTCSTIMAGAVALGVSGAVISKKDKSIKDKNESLKRSFQSYMAEADKKIQFQNLMIQNTVSDIYDLINKIEAGLNEVSLEKKKEETEQ